MSKSAALARFGGSVLDRLDARVSPRPSAATRIALDLIDEDPDQPRRDFDPAKLEQLAASIRMVGVLQPVGVQSSPGGRYFLRWGARRVRAARLAGLADVPAVLVGAEQGGLDAQVVENQHRVGNTNSELAAVVDRLKEQGRSNADIALALALPSVQYIKLYRALSGLRDIEEIARWIDTADIRALYELHLGLASGDGAHRPAILRALSGVDELTVTSVRRLLATLKVPAAEPVTNIAADRRRRLQDTPSPTDDIAEQERVAKVRAWLELSERPRPPLTV